MISRDLLGVISIIIALISYSFYFRGIFTNQTKPHAFSWLVWGMLMFINFFAQVSGNAGPGSWVTGFTALICFAISLIAFHRGLRRIKPSDYLSLGVAVLSILLWRLTAEPNLAIILTAIAYISGFYPTIHKSFKRPQDETVITYLLNGLKFLIAIFALSKFSFVTAFYPIVLVIANWSFVGVLIVEKRRRR